LALATISADGDRFTVSVDPTTQRLSRLQTPDGANILDMMHVIQHYADTTDFARLKLVPTELFFGDVTISAPFVPPRSVMCVGKNYRDHAKEFAASGYDKSSRSAEAVPVYPIIFTKMASTIVGPNDSIRYPEGLTSALDYEAELAVIIGKGGRGISKAEAIKHIFGYTIVNDVTARDRQAAHAQWFIGKSMDTFCPMGPLVVTRDEVDGADLDIVCWVNGAERQRANTRDLIFDIPTLIETISAGLTLIPGDVIATGTPAGVGIGFDPPRFLQRGDEIVVEIEGIGRLTNRVA
jgi:2-keto-4-pentenoate hydratase/2-oxohepta-3-ene-1,7-dioic acid hydratase in catechol pathway